MKNPLLWFLIGPLVLLIAASSYAALLQLALLFNKQQSALDLVRRAADRLGALKSASSALWGGAIFIVLLALAAVLINIKPLAWLGIASAFALALALGLACAAAALFAEQRLSGDADPDAASPAWSAAGWRMLVFAAALPIVGWLGGAALITSALGLLAELITTRLTRRGG